MSCSTQGSVCVVVAINVLQDLRLVVACHAFTVLLCLQAVEAGRLDVTQKLIDFGVVLRVFDATLNTPLHLAVRLNKQALQLGFCFYMPSCCISCLHSWAVRFSDCLLCKQCVQDTWNICIQSSELIVHMFCRTKRPGTRWHSCC